MNTKTSFDDWMRTVDAYVERLAGVSVYDLADYAFRDAYDYGRTPLSVARAALRNEGF